MNVLKLIVEFLLSLLRKKAEQRQVELPRDYYLDDAQMEAVRASRPFYIYAAEITGKIPWQALAGIHYREAEFSHRSAVKGGPFQLDPGGEGASLDAKIEAYVRQVCERYRKPYGDIETDFNTAALVAAHELATKVRSPIIGAAGIDEDALADALWGYNGRAKFHTLTGIPDGGQSWRYSPYVSNDPKKGIILRLKGSIPDATVPGGRRRIDIEDKRPGALIIYRELIARSSELDA